MRMLALGAACLVVLGVGTWLGWRAAVGYVSASEQVSGRPALAGARLRDELEGLQREAEMLRTRHEVDRRALEMLRQEMARMEERATELEDAVRFYRSLMAPEQVGQGLTLREPELVALEAPGRYSFRFVVQQNARKHERVEGELAVQISGLVGEEAVSYPLSALSEELAEGPLPLEFRYFQSLEGELQLPPALKPRSILVVARTIRPRELEVRNEFPWQLQERFTHVGQ